jgi:hypothetical protein
MGIETLQSAARAAGFAMVDADEPGGEAAKKADEGRRIGTPALLLKDQKEAVEKAQATFGEWVKGMLGSSGRAPA